MTQSVLHILTAVALAYIAYLAVINNVHYAGWFVFLAVVYAL